MATPPTRATTEPGDESKGDTGQTADGKEGVLGKGAANVKEDLLEGGDGELGLDDVGAVNNLIERFHDGCAADEDVVARDRVVPISPTL